MKIIMEISKDKHKISKKELKKYLTEKVCNSAGYTPEQKKKMESLVSEEVNDFVEHLKVEGAVLVD